MESIDEKPVDIRDYFHVMIRRRWTILAIFLLTALLVAVHTFTEIPIYKASARIIIEKENPNVVSIEEVMAVDSTGTDYYQTQYKIIESRGVAREVIQRLNLEESEEFFPPPRTDLVSKLKGGFRQGVRIVSDFYTRQIRSLLRTGQAAEIPGKGAAGEAGDVAPDVDPKLVSEFIGRIQVEPIRNSRLVDVGIEARNPAMAARMANELVRAYIDQNLETKLMAAKDAVKWLTERIDEERKKVETAENALLEYKKENNIITDFSSDSENITAEKLARLNEQAIEAESRRVEAETRYRQALALKDNPDMLDSIPEVLTNELVQEIKKMEVDLYNRVSELSKKYGQNHPKMVAIQSELADLKERKAREAQRVINSLRNEYQLALARERSLKRALENQKEESLSLNKKAIQYSVLQRQAESSKQMYDLLIKRFKETSLTEEMKTGNIRIIDEAQVPIHPIKPRKKRNILLGVVVGLMLGVGLAFLLEYLDNTLKAPEDLRDQYGISYLGLVPAFDAQENIDGYAGDLIAFHSPTSIPSESFRSIRTGILFSSPDVNPQVILVTSSGPDEGKSLCSGNLAVAMAQAESGVLLMDCDMRRSRMPFLFGEKSENGLSSVVVGASSLEDEIRPTGIDGLDILPCGQAPPNPADLLGSNKMGELVDELRKKYKRIIIDTPPLTAVADAAILSQRTDGVVLVVHAGVTPKKVVEKGIEQLRLVGARILGAVLNGVDVKRDSYYYSGYYYGGYYNKPTANKKRIGKKMKRKI